MTRTPAFSLVLALYQLTWMLIQVIYQLIDAIQAINSFIFLSYMESHQVGTIQDLRWLTPCLLPEIHLLDSGMEHPFIKYRGGAGPDASFPCRTLRVFEPGGS